MGKQFYDEKPGSTTNKPEPMYGGTIVTGPELVVGRCYRFRYWNSETRRHAHPTGIWSHEILFRFEGVNAWPSGGRGTIIKGTNSGPYTRDGENLRGVFHIDMDLRRALAYFEEVPDPTAAGPDCGPQDRDTNAV